MLLVKTYIASSSIHGLGLFAAQPIAKGTIVWEHREGYDIRLTVDFVEQLPETAKAHVKHYCALLDDGTYMTTFDNDRFLNHSENPNLITDAKTYSLISARDIAAGEELTEDYRVLDVQNRQDGNPDSPEDEPLLSRTTRTM